MIAYQHYHAGRYDEAHERFRQALETCRRFGYQRGIAKGLLAMGNSALAKKLYPEARQHYGDAIALNKSLGQLGAAAYAVYQSAIVAHREGHLDDAERDYNEAGDYARKEKDRVLEAAVLAQLAKLMLDKGDRQAAERNAKKALEQAHDLDDHLTRVTAACTLGLLQETSGQDANAHETRVAAGNARATIKGVQDQIATLEKISEVIVSVSFGEETHTSRDLDRGSPRINFPDRIIGDSIDLTYSDREPGGFGRGGGRSDDDSGGGGFGGGFTDGNF
jgi:tetratricopeptide (TPR) repeat protein